MKNHGILKMALLVGFLPGLFLVWGFSMAKYEVFPFSQLQALKLHVFPSKPVYRLPITEDPQWDMAVSQFKILKSRPTIVMLGDSITAGAEWQELIPEASIVNRGIPKDTTHGLLLRLNEVSSRMPEAVFILIGINDLRRGELVEDVFSRYREILMFFESKGIQVFVQSTILPGGNVAEDRHQQVTELNEQLEQYCSQRSGLIFLDLNNVLAPDGQLKAEYTSDGIHLNGAGYFEWTQVIEPKIEQVGAGQSSIRSESK